MALPALVLLLTAAIGGIGGVITKLRCYDAAREAAVAESRGEAGTAGARRLAPDGATIRIQSEGDLVRVLVRAEVRPLGPGLPGFTVEAQAVALTEPGR